MSMLTIASFPALACGRLQALIYQLPCGRVAGSKPTWNVGEKHTTMRKTCNGPCEPYVGAGCRGGGGGLAEDVEDTPLLLASPSTSRS